MVLSTLLPSSSDALCITQPSPMTSFDWSDFPLVHQFNPEHDENETQLHFHDDATSLDTRSFQDNPKSIKCKLNENLNNNELFSSIQPAFFLSSSDSSLSSSTSDMDDSSRHSRVSFAPRVEIREYNLILGDHPMCESLPLSLGWSYSQESSFQDYAQTTRRHGNQLKLTFMERRNRLARVGGYSQGELRMKIASRLHHVPTTSHLPSSTES